MKKRKVSAPTLQWPAGTRRLGDLKPYLHNPRKISRKAYEQLKKNIQEQGYRNPIAITKDDVVLCGHQRLDVLKDLNDDDFLVNVIVSPNDLTEAEIKRIVASDNLSFGEYDYSILAAEYDLADLVDVGFDPIDLKALDLSLAPEENLDDFDDTPAEDPVAKLGDVWTLGEHRVLCGDSTVRLNYDVLCISTPKLMVTDPPYGVEYDPTRTSNNKKKAGKVLNDEISDWAASYALFRGDVAYVWHASAFTDVVLNGLRNCGFEHRSMIIWNKDRFTLGRGNYKWKHEPCWYVVRNGRRANWVGGNNKATVWDIKAREDKGHGHGTQKPVECMRRPILNNTILGDIVYDPFLGSGTTLIAADSVGRVCYGMELNPAYVDIIIKRYEAVTGNKATDQDGLTFAQRKENGKSRNENQPEKRGSYKKEVS